MKFKFVSLLIVIFQQAFLINGFGYSEPHQRRWARHHGLCAGKYQSPIALHSTRSIPLHMPAIDMVGYHNLLPHPLTMTNNGHTVAITIPKYSSEDLENGEFMPYIRGGKLPGEFELETVHFHWGDKNNRGAEHVVNDIRYTMEMHIVHRNKKYATLPEALEHPDGAAVLAFFYNLDEDEDKGLLTICRHLHLIPDAGNEIALNVTFSLASLLKDVDLDIFYTYKGSLTTPPCAEAITWTLYPHPLKISTKQISRFRQLMDVQDDALVDNYRHLQPLGNRRIFIRSSTQHASNAVLDNELDYRKWDWLH